MRTSRADLKLGPARLVAKPARLRTYIQKAIETIEKAITLAPTSLSAHEHRLDLAKLYETFQDFEKAVQVVQTQLAALDAEPHDRMFSTYFYYYRLGGIYRKMGQFSEAIASYERSIEIQVEQRIMIIQSGPNSTLSKIVKMYTENANYDNFNAVERIKSEIIKSPKCEHLRS